MTAAAGGSRRPSRRTAALIGVGGAILSGVGDVLLLGRSASGRDFDRAEGMIPSHVDADRRWRSLWNGAELSARRVHVGTVTGTVGIGVLQWLSLHAIGGATPPGPRRRLATASAAAFAVSGVLTHVCCGTVIQAYRREASLEPTDASRPSPRSVTPLLAASAVGVFGALALFSGNLTIEALRRDPPASRWAFVTPLPCVLSTLLGFGLLPAPVAGYVRPASMSIGLLLYFAVTAASADS